MQEIPYYAVIFTSTLSNSTKGYQEMAAYMESLAKKQPGYLGIESARETIGITISYWKSPEAILQWKNNLDHQQAQKLGREKWYASYTIRICKVERSYTFSQKKL